jgi:hypothetical protein
LCLFWVYEPNAPLSLTDRFALPLQGLYAAVAARYRSVGWTIPMVVLVCNRIRRVERLVVELLALFLAGALPDETVPEVLTRAKRARTGCVAKERIPRGYGWLIRMIPYVAAGYAGQLRLALADPEMMALLAASPKARQALRVLCHMLMIEPEVIAPKVSAAKLDDAAVAPQDSGADDAAAVKVAGDPGSAPAMVEHTTAFYPSWAAALARGPPSG